MTITYSIPTLLPDAVYCYHIDRPDAAHSCIPLGGGCILYLCPECYDGIKAQLVNAFFAGIVKDVLDGSFGAN